MRPRHLLALLIVIAAGLLPTVATVSADSIYRSGERILFGTPASATDNVIRIMLSLQVRQDDGTFRHTCGAMLIAPRVIDGHVEGWRTRFRTTEASEWAMTAAHCFFPRAGEPIPRDRFRVVAGVLGLDAASIARASVQPVVTVVIPGDVSGDAAFSNNTLVNDIALLRLGSEALRTGKRDYSPGPIAFPRSNESWSRAPYALVFASGWGQTETGYSSDVLLEVRLPVVDDPTCRRVFSQLEPPLTIRGGMLCAGFSTGAYDSCGGDSGGPLFYRPGTGRPTPDHILVGIVSWGVNCGVPGRFGVYTDIAYFEQWVIDRLEELI